MTNIPGEKEGRGNFGDEVTQKAALVATGLALGTAAVLLVWIVNNLGEGISERGSRRGNLGEGI